MIASELLSGNGHSPDIRMDLLMGGQRFQLAQMCDGDITVREPRQMPPGIATVRLTVGTEVTIYEINLPHGIDPARRKQSYRLLRTIEGAAA
ncbi:MAG: hypothetical protein JWN40_5978 [Phycisphaerales bacterium]|nr:hypothetical protein [Phycisphaerales bacterium]